MEKPTSTYYMIFLSLLCLSLIYGSMLNPTQFIPSKLLTKKNSLSNEVDSKIIQRKPFKIQTFFEFLNDEIRFRKLSIDQYREKINEKIRRKIESFKYDQDLVRVDVQNKLDNYLNRFNQLYNESIESLKMQQESINELNNKYIRPKRIDESLEEFRRIYNESLFQGLSNDIMKYNSKMKRIPMSQIDNININLKNNIKFVNKVLNKTFDDITKIQDDIKQKTKFIEISTPLTTILNKEEIR